MAEDPKNPKTIVLSFGSDNQSPIHPKVLEYIAHANNGYTIGYGNDWYTQKAKMLLHDEFGDCTIAFTFTGTASNVIGLAQTTRSHQAIIAPHSAHITTDECGAPEKFLGSKILTVQSPDGKITTADIKKIISNLKPVHNVKPRIISITQSTEYGTVYSQEELRILCDYAHEHDMLVHMDGNRLYNAAVSLNMSLRELSRDVGVDILALGGTKNGGLCAEALLIFNKEHAHQLEYLHKQSMQLASKMRYLSAQFIALFEEKLWYHNALNANNMALMLSQKLSEIPGITITQKVQANAIFAKVPYETLTALQSTFYCYPWNKEESEIRIMTSWCTTENDIEKLLQIIKK